MRLREFSAEQWFPRSREELFAFFCNAANLDAITPPWLKFRTVTRGPIVMCEGTSIDYKLRIRGVPIRWRTRIAVWEPPERFVDEQLRGPYRFWRHEHTFERRNGGALMRDRVQYAVPFSWIVHKLLVRPDVERIFAYRAEKLNERFATPGQLTID